MVPLWPNAQLPDNSPLLLMTRCAGTSFRDSFMIQPIMRASRVTHGFAGPALDCYRISLFTTGHSQHTGTTNEAVANHPKARQISIHDERIGDAGSLRMRYMRRSLGLTGVLEASSRICFSASSVRSRVGSQP